jgi:hypothetical protein
MEKSNYDNLPPLTERGQFWLAHLENCQSRKIPLTRYAVENELNLSSLYSWQGRLRRTGHFQKGATSHFRRLQVLPSVPAPPIRIRLPNGLSVEWTGTSGKAMLQDAIKAALLLS